MIAKLSRGISYSLPWLVFLILPFIYFISETHAVFLFELFAALAAIVFSLQQKDAKIKSTTMILFVFFTVWGLLAARSVWLSVDYSTSASSIIKLFSLFLLIYITYSSAKVDAFFYPNCFNAALVTGLLHSTIAIAEYIEGAPVPATWLDPGLKEYLRTRCAGIFTDPNIFGAFLSFIFVIIMARLLITEKTQARIAFSLGLFVCGIAILTTLSRGSWIALACALVYLFVLNLKNKQINSASSKIIYSIIIVIGLITILGPFKYRVFSIIETSDMTIGQRSLIFKSIVNKFSRVPITGYGLHSFNQIYPQYRLVGGDYPMNAHNELLHSTLETGILSAILQLAIFLFLFYKTSVACKSKPDIITSAFAACFIMFFVHNLSGFSSRILPTAALISFSTATLLKIRATRLRVLPDLTTCFKLFIIFIALLCLSRGFADFRVKQLLKQTDSLVKAKNLQGGLATLNQAIKLQPENAILHARKSRIFAAANDLPKASREINQALALNPQEALYWIYKARLIQASSLIEAEKCYKKAIELDPASELFRLEFAQFYLKLNHRDKALRQLDLALDFSPGYHEVYTNYLAVEKLRDALKK
jgi:O-antigen ligase